MNQNVNIIREVRAVMPRRALQLNEAFAVAEHQADELLKLLEITSPAVDVAQLAELPKITVKLIPRHRMPTMSGFSRWDDGNWLIGINKNNPPGRRRFTLAHELKHVLDNRDFAVAYRDIGRGDDSDRSRQLELVCNYFAACFLMPASFIKHVWQQGIQDEEALAGLFKVSVEAMHTRLIYLGYVDEDRRPLAEYFRTESQPNTEVTA